MIISLQLDSTSIALLSECINKSMPVNSYIEKSSEKWPQPDGGFVG